MAFQLIPSDLGSYEHPNDPGEPSTGVRRLSVTDNEMQILSALAFQMVACEIGTGLGVSTRAIAKYAETLVSIDLDPWVADTIAPILEDELGDNFAFVCNRDLIADERQFDFFFIDGDHSTEAASADIEWAFEHAYEGSLIVLHDARYPKVRRAIPDDAIFIETEHGLAVIPVR